jgi:hypothetical protein
MLDDGVYDAFVVDAEVDGDALRLDLTIISGPQKGEVVSVRAVGLDGDELDCLGLPATLTIADGAPSIALDR